MKKALLVAAMATFGSGMAMAADLGRPMVTKAPPAAVPYYNWTGFYAGVNLGGAFGRMKARDDDAVGSTNLDGFAGGGQIGYNWQFNNVVFGVETDFQGSTQSQSGAAEFDVVDANGNVIGVANGTGRARINYFGTVRGRLGLAVDRGLFYFTGGYAYQNVKFDATFPGVGSASTSSTRSGWTVGGGLEYAFAGPWTAGVEYLYIDTGRRNFEFDGDIVNVKTTNNIVRAKLNYRF